MTIRKYLTLFLVTMLAGIVTACDDKASQGSTVKPSLLRIAPLPEESAAALQARYQPLLDHIQKETGITTELVITTNYKDLLSKFRNGQIDVAKFGAVTYLKAHKESAAQPLVTRDIDLLFTSVVLVRKESPFRSLQDLQNKPFAFGSKLSTSGHLMPRSYFAENGIQPETYFSEIKYSGAHDKTAYMVRDRQVDAGVMNANIARSMFGDGRLSSSEVRIIWESPQYIDYVWARQKDLPGETVAVLKDAFISLDKGNPAHNLILKKLGANYYLAARHQSFSTLEKIVSEVERKGLLK